MKKLLSAGGCAAFLLCVLPVHAGTVTLSAVSGQPVQVSETIESKGILWRDGPDHLCVYLGDGATTFTNEQVYNISVTYQGKDYGSGCNCSSDIGNFGCAIPTVAPGSIASFTLTNKNTVSGIQEVRFYQQGTLSSFHKWAVASFSLPAASVVSAEVQNNISVDLKGNEMKNVKLSSPVTEGGILTFTPDKSDGTQGEITAGDNAIKYQVKDAEWSGRSWTAENSADISLIINPYHEKLTPGAYSGTMQAGLAVP